MAIRVALVDDDKLIHEAVKIVLEQADDILFVGQVFRGSEAQEMVRLSRPDVVLMDVVMPMMKGDAVTRLLLSEWPNLKILVLSSYQDYDHVRSLMDAGAVGYVIKTAIADDLVNTIRLTAQGSTVMSSDVAQTLISGAMTPPATDPFGLTERELAVLNLLAKGMSNNQAALELSVSERTIRFHANNILEKMKVGTRSEALVLAAKHNLV